MRLNAMDRARVRVCAPALAAITLLGLTGCLGSESVKYTTPGDEPSPTPSDPPPPSPGPSPTGGPSESIGPPATPPPGSPVIPDIFLATIDTDDGLLRVVVVIPGIYENGGLCTVRVAGVSSTILRDGTGEADVSSTACGQFTFSLSQLGTGKASIMATYESTDYSGVSETMEVEIP